MKLTLPDGSTTDVSTQTARLFVSSTPDGFIDLLRAMRPGPAMPLRMGKYLVTHPRLVGALPVLRDANRVPASYATVSYHGLHAFRWVAADGSARFVRYHLRPVADEEFLSGSGAQRKWRLSPPRAQPPPGARAGAVRLRRPDRRAERLDGRSVGYLAQHPDRHRRQPRDHRPRHRARARRGHVAFDPIRVTDGIEPSDDPVFGSGPTLTRLGQAAHRRGSRTRGTARLRGASQAAARNPSGN